MWYFYNLTYNLCAIIIYTGYSINLLRVRTGKIFKLFSDLANITTNFFSIFIYQLGPSVVKVYQTNCLKEEVSNLFGQFVTICGPNAKSMNHLCYNWIKIYIKVVNDRLTVSLSIIPMPGEIRIARMLMNLFPT